MSTSPALSSALGLGTGLVALGVLTFAPSLVGGGEAFPPGGTAGRAIDAGGEAALLGTAAIAGAGTEIRHVRSFPWGERHPVRAERHLRQALRAR